MTVISRTLRSQFGWPRGALGGVAGAVMARRPSNVERSRWTVDLLELEPGHHVLEVGPGPGVGLQAALERTTSGHVVGVERSVAMVRMAARRNDAAVRAGRLSLVLADAERLPGWLRPFDSVFACNVSMFWGDRPRVLADLAARLTPGGRMAITHMPPARGADPTPAREAAVALRSELDAAGLCDVRIVEAVVAGAPAVCVLAIAPPAAASCSDRRAG